MKNVLKLQKIGYSGGIVDKDRNKVLLFGKEITIFMIPQKTNQIIDTNSLFTRIMNIPIFVDRHSGPVLGALIDQVNIFTITHGNDSRIIIWDTDNG